VSVAELIRSRPISLVGTNAAAILAGNVTQLRRVGTSFQTLRPGMKLWVRERVRFAKVFDDFAPLHILSVASPGAPTRVLFEADLATPPHPDLGFGRVRFAREMPKALHRAHLIVDAVRREALHQVTEEDARAEGVGRLAAYPAWWNETNGKEARSISGDPGRWADNPMTTVIGFTLVREPLA
jgi:hypothetical protein